MKFLSALALIGALILGGCERNPPMELRYLTGFVPGSHDIFGRTTFAIAPVTGAQAKGPAIVGAVYEPDGKVERNLIVASPGEAVARALVLCLDDAGLLAFQLHHGTSAEKTHTPPAYAPYLLECELTRMSVVKRFAAQQTVHGQVFKMEARVELSCRLYDKHGAQLYAGSVSGSEMEPPNPVGHEAFLPMETEPAESLSVALSRAVGALPLVAQFRQALPARGPAGEPIASPAPSR